MEKTVKTAEEIYNARVVFFKERFTQRERELLSGKMSLVEKTPKRVKKMELFLRFKWAVSERPCLSVYIERAIFELTGHSSVEEFLSFLAFLEEGLEEEIEESKTPLIFDNNKQWIDFLELYGKYLLTCEEFEKKTPG